MISKRKYYICGAALLTACSLFIFAPLKDPDLEGRPSVALSSTTTTPTPPEALLRQWNADDGDASIEKYDPLKVYYGIMRTRIKKMTERFKPKTVGGVAPVNFSNPNIHMFYADRLKVKKNNNDTTDKHPDDVMLQNFRLARSVGCGTVFVEYPHIYATFNENYKMRSLFDAASSYDIKISIVIRDYFRRSVFSVRQDLISFLKLYGQHPALYRLKVPKAQGNAPLPVVYVKHSYALPHEQWKQMLTADGKLSVKGSKYDAVLLAHVRDEEHFDDARRSRFDGFFACCDPNGERYGASWKNWPSLGAWSRSRDLIWSAGVVEGKEGAPTVRTALNAASSAHPTFVSFDGAAAFKQESLAMMREWNYAWWNVTRSKGDVSFL